MISKVVHKKSNMAAGPASYCMTDTMGRMHSDAQFARSSSVKPYGLFLLRTSAIQTSLIALGMSSVPAHVEINLFLCNYLNPCHFVSIKRPYFMDSTSFCSSYPQKQPISWIESPIAPNERPVSDGS